MTRAAPLALVAALLAGCRSDPAREVDRDPRIRSDRASDPRSPRASAASREARLLVDSVPSDAAVHVDGALRGTTPLEVKDLPAGPHRVTVDSPAGHREERVVLDRGETRTVVVTAWEPRPTTPARTPEQLGRAIAHAFEAKDRAALEALLPSRGELAACLGGVDPDRARTALLARIDEDWAYLMESSGVHRARRIRAGNLEVRRGPVSSDAFARPVDAVPAPVLIYEVDGRSMTVRLGPFVRVDDGGWKLLSLLPSRYR